jgi:hypothetical protein
MTIENIAGTINTGSNPRALWPGVRTWWGMNYDEHDAYYKKLYDSVSSNKAYEVAVEESGFGLAPRKGEGESIRYDSAKALADVPTRNIAYGMGFVITREAIDDNLYDDQIRKYTKALARSMTATKETKAALKFANNDATADGVSLFSTSHKAIKGTQGNLLGTQAALSLAAVEDVLIMIDEAKDNRGLPIKLAPKGLVVAPKNKFKAMTITNSFLNPDVNGSNQVNPLFDFFKEGTVANPYFAGIADDLWFVKTDADDAFVHYIRKPIEISRDNEFDTENLKVKAYERYSFGLIDWRGAFAGKL